MSFAWLVGVMVVAPLITTLGLALRAMRARRAVRRHVSLVCPRSRLEADMLVSYDPEDRRFLRVLGCSERDRRGVGRCRETCLRLANCRRGERYETVSS